MYLSQEAGQLLDDISKDGAQVNIQFGSGHTGESLHSEDSCDLVSQFVQ